MSLHTSFWLAHEKQRKTPNQPCHNVLLSFQTVPWFALSGLPQCTQMTLRIWSLFYLLVNKNKWGSAQSTEDISIFHCHIIVCIPLIADKRNGTSLQLESESWSVILIRIYIFISQHSFHTSNLTFLTFDDRENNDSISGRLIHASTLHRVHLCALYLQKQQYLWKQYVAFFEDSLCAN